MFFVFVFSEMKQVWSPVNGVLLELAIAAGAASWSFTI